MSRALLGCLAIAMLVGTPALAADMAVKAPVVPAAAGSWFWSVSGGYDLPSEKQFLIGDPNVVGGVRAGFGGGFTGRGTVGYRWTNWDVAVAAEGADLSHGTPQLSYTGFLAPALTHSPSGSYWAVDGELGYTLGNPGAKLRVFVGPRFATWQMSDSDGSAPVPFTFQQRSDAVGPRVGFQSSGPLGAQNLGWFADASISALYGNLKGTAGGSGTGTLTITKNYWQADGKLGLEWQVAPLSKLAVGYQFSYWDGALAAVEYNGFGIPLLGGSAITLLQGPFIRFTYNQ